MGDGNFYLDVSDYSLLVSEWILVTLALNECKALQHRNHRLELATLFKSRHLPSHWRWVNMAEPHLLKRDHDNSK